MSFQYRTQVINYSGFETTVITLEWSYYSVTRIWEHYSPTNWTIGL